MNSSNKFLTGALFACALVVGCGSDDNKAQPLTEAPVTPAVAGVDPDIALKAAFTAKIEGVWETSCITTSSKDPKKAVFAGRVVVFNPVVLDSWNYYQNQADCDKGKSEIDDGAKLGLITTSGGYYSMMEVGAASDAFPNTRKFDMHSQTAGNIFHLLQVNQPADPKIAPNLFFGNTNKKSVRSGIIRNGSKAESRPDDLDKSIAYTLRPGVNPALVVHPSIKLRVENEVALSDAHKAEIAGLQKKMDGLLADARNKMKEVDAAKATALTDLEKTLRKEMADKLAKSAELKKSSDEASKKDLEKSVADVAALRKELKKVQDELVAVNRNLSLKQTEFEKAETARVRAESAGRDSDKSLDEQRAHLAVLEADHDRMAKAVLNQAGIIQRQNAEIQKKDGAIQKKDGIIQSQDAEIERLEKIIYEK